MPLFRQYTSVVARGFRAFVNLEAGLVRDGASLENLKWAASQNGDLERARRQLANKVESVRSCRPDGYSVGAGRVNPENIVWIFGDGRTGSTWLMRMVEDLEGQTLWREPMVGLLFGYLYYLWADEKRYATKHFILGRYRESWLTSMRSFVLQESKDEVP